MINTYKYQKKGLILLSGGLDSTTTLYFAKRQKYKLTAIIFDYNQRHKKEIIYAKKIASLNKIDYYIIKININWTKSSLIDKTMKIPINRELDKKDIPNTYVSGRNIIFLSYAFSLAETLSINTIFIGAHMQDYSGYPDCREEFFRNFQKTANLGMKNFTIRIKTPLINKSKKEIVKLGLSLGVPFKYTWSCYNGYKFPCLECDSCRFRIMAFEELGLKDPLLV